MAATTPERAPWAKPDVSTEGELAPGVFGPSVPGGKPRNGGVDLLRFLGIVVSVVLIFAVGTGSYYAYLFWDAQQDVGDVSIVDPASDVFEIAPGVDGPLVFDAPVVLEDRTTILLVGSDSRDGLSREELDRIGTDATGTDLTDTIILLQIDPNTDAAAMLSFPRDLLVERCDGSTGRINEAFYVGTLQGEGLGPQCLINTIVGLTGIEIDHYARVNFAGFVQAVDALGGVTFYIEEPLQDAYSGLDIPAGCVDFDGVGAIQFVRARRIDSDFGRIARQQRFAREMIRKATSVGTLLNPGRVTALVSSIADTLETDTEFGAGEMISLINSVRGISSGTVDGRTVPAVVGRYGEASVVRLIEPDAEALFDAFRNGDLLPEGLGTDAGPVELGPENVIPIMVSDGNADEGVVERTAEVLEALGFSVSDTGEAENYSFGGSIIFYPEFREDHAQFLSEALGGLQISPRNDDVDELQLVLGSTFDPEEFAPEPAPSDSPSASASPTPEATEETFAGAEISDIEC